ncbi:hypothetical protein [Streptomyces sp. NPDC059783]|uniref:hypothetical protein n=1 Tax=Streptomyces sp. NPDC059783 TaxID=3346944 RepID=UPI0036507596
MQRGLVHTLAWSLATGAAVTLTWWGVHTVMAGTAYDPPRAVPITTDDRDAATTLASSTHRPRPTPSPTRTAPGATPTPSAAPSRAPSHTPAGSPRPAAASSGTARSYATDGGRVVFEFRADAATLVSATPDQGWSVQVWTNSTWIRVNFAKVDGTTVSVYCTWHDHPPKVDVVAS